MSDLFEEPENATPLTPEERDALIPADISFRHELNAKDLHGRMLGAVWRWAGKFRTSERNLGIPHYEIPMALRQLLDDAKTWIEYGTYRPTRSPYAFITG